MRIIMLRLQEVSDTYFKNMFWGRGTGTRVSPIGRNTSLLTIHLQVDIPEDNT